MAIKIDRQRLNLIGRIILREVEISKDDGRTRTCYLCNKPIIDGQAIVLGDCEGFKYSVDRKCLSEINGFSANN